MTTDFVAFVSQMRTAQKDARLDHSRASILQARDLERRVDSYLLRYFNQRHKEEQLQTSFFGSD